MGLRALLKGPTAEQILPWPHLGSNHGPYGSKSSSLTAMLQAAADRGIKAFKLSVPVIRHLSIHTQVLVLLNRNNLCICFKCKNKCEQYECCVELGVLKMPFVWQVTV